MTATNLNEDKASHEYLEKISAIIDGELQDFSDEELNALLDDLSENDDLRDMWQTSFMMRDILVEDQTQVPVSNDFFKKFSDAFENEPTIIAPHAMTSKSTSINQNTESAQILSFQDAKQQKESKPTTEKNPKHPIWSLALAASVAVITVSGIFLKSNDEATTPLPITASTHNLQSIEQNMNHQLVSMTENIKKADEEALKNKDVAQTSSIYLPKKENPSSFQRANYNE